MINNYELLAQQYNNNPTSLTEEQVDELELIAKTHNKPFKRNVEASSFNLLNTASQFFNGYLQGFTTIPVGEEPTNTVDAISRNIGHLLGFMGILPGPGLARKIIPKTIGKSFGLHNPNLPMKMHVKSLPMLITDKVGEIAEKTFSTYTKNAEAFLGKGGYDIAKGALHLGTASAIGTLPPWQLDISQRMQGFIGGAIFGAGNRALGNLISPKGKLAAASLPEGYKNTAEYFKKDPEGYKSMMRSNAIARAAASSIIFGLPSTLRGDPLELQVYDYLLNAYFGYGEMPYYQRNALNITNKYANTLQGQIGLLKPERLSEWKELNVKEKDELEYQAEVAVGKQIILDEQKKLAITEQGAVISKAIAQAVREGDYDKAKEYTKQLDSVDKESVSTIYHNEYLKSIQSGLSEEKANDNALLKAQNYLTETKLNFIVNRIKEKEFTNASDNDLYSTLITVNKEFKDKQINLRFTDPLKRISEIFYDNPKKRVEQYKIYTDMFKEEYLTAKEDMTKNTNSKDNVVLTTLNKITKKISDLEKSTITKLGPEKSEKLKEEFRKINGLLNKVFLQRKRNLKLLDLTDNAIKPLPSFQSGKLQNDIYVSDPELYKIFGDSIEELVSVKEDYDIPKDDPEKQETETRSKLTYIYDYLSDQKSSLDLVELNKKIWENDKWLFSGNKAQDSTYLIDKKEFLKDDNNRLLFEQSLQEIKNNRHFLEFDYSDEFKRDGKVIPDYKDKLDEQDAALLTFFKKRTGKTFEELMQDPKGNLLNIVDLNKRMQILNGGGLRLNDTQMDIFIQEGAKTNPFYQGMNSKEEEYVIIKDNNMPEEDGGSISKVIDFIAKNIGEQSGHGAAKIYSVGNDYISKKAYHEWLEGDYKGIPNSVATIEYTSTMKQKPNGIKHIKLMNDVWVDAKTEVPITDWNGYIGKRKWSDTRLIKISHPDRELQDRNTLIQYTRFLNNELRKEWLENVGMQSFEGNKDTNDAFDVYVEELKKISPSTEQLQNLMKNIDFDKLSIVNKIVLLKGTNKTNNPLFKKVMENFLNLEKLGETTNSNDIIDDVSVNDIEFLLGDPAKNMIQAFDYPTITEHKFVADYWDKLITKRLMRDLITPKIPGSMYLISANITPLTRKIRENYLEKLNKIFPNKYTEDDIYLISEEAAARKYIDFNGKKVSYKSLIDELYKTTPIYTDEELEKYIKVSDWSKAHRTPSDGTDADRTMRLLAQGFIGEIIREDSSSAASKRFIEKNRETNIHTIMLARNSELASKPLREDTKRQILEAHKKGIKFIVGNSYIDIPFINYLKEIKAKYTIYGHEGRKDGDYIPEKKKPIINIQQNNKDVLEALDLLVARAPIDSKSGVRNLLLAGYIPKAKGNKIWLSNKNMSYLGGADNDIDAFHMFNASKKIKDFFRSNKDEWHLNGKFIEQKKYEGLKVTKGINKEVFFNAFELKKLNYIANAGVKGLGPILNFSNRMRNIIDAYPELKVGDTLDLSSLETEFQGISKFDYSKKLDYVIRELINMAADASDGNIPKSFQDASDFIKENFNLDFNKLKNGEYYAKLDNMFKELDAKLNGHNYEKNRAYKFNEILDTFANQEYDNIITSEIAKENYFSPQYILATRLGKAYKEAEKKFVDNGIKGASGYLSKLLFSFNQNQEFLSFLNRTKQVVIQPNSIAYKQRIKKAILSDPDFLELKKAREKGELTSEQQMYRLRQIKDRIKHHFQFNDVWDAVSVTAAYRLYSKIKEKNPNLNVKEYQDIADKIEEFKRLYSDVLTIKRQFTNTETEKKDKNELFDNLIDDVVRYRKSLSNKDFQDYFDIMMSGSILSGKLNGDHYGTNIHSLVSHILPYMDVNNAKMMGYILDNAIIEARKEPIEKAVPKRALGFTELNDDILSDNYTSKDFILRALEIDKIVPTDTIDNTEVQKVLNVLKKYPQLLTDKHTIEDIFNSYMYHKYGQTVRLQNITKPLFNEFITELENYNFTPPSLRKIHYFWHPSEFNEVFNYAGDMSKMLISMPVTNLNNVIEMQKFNVFLSTPEKIRLLGIQTGKVKASLIDQVNEKWNKNELNRLFNLLEQKHGLEVAQKIITYSVFQRENQLKQIKQDDGLNDKRQEVIDTIKKELSDTIFILDKPKLLDEVSYDINALIDIEWKDAKQLIYGIKDREELERYTLYSKDNVGRYFDLEKYYFDLINNNIAINEMTLYKTYQIAHQAAVNTASFTLRDYSITDGKLVRTPNAETTFKLYDIKDKQDRAEVLSLLDKMGYELNYDPFNKQVKSKVYTNTLTSQLNTYSAIKRAFSLPDPDKLNSSFYWHRTGFSKKAIEEHNQKELERLKANGEADVDIYIKNILRKDDYLNEVLDMDKGAQDLIDLFDGLSNNRQFETSGLYSQVQAFRERNKENSIWGYSTKLEEIRKYSDKITKEIGNKLFAALSHDEINRFQASKIFGNKTEEWSVFLKDYIRQSIGYPTLYPKYILENEKFQIKGNPYFWLTDEAWQGKAKRITDELFDGIPEETIRRKYENKKSKGDFNKHDTSYESYKNLLYHQILNHNKKITAKKRAWFSNLEGKFSMMTLLSHSKTMINNIFGGSVMNLSNTSLRHLRKATDLNYLQTINEKWNNWNEISRDIAKVGGLESFLTVDITGSEQFRASNWTEFFKAAKREINYNPSLSDATLYEIAGNYGITKVMIDASAQFMKYSERFNRIQSWLSHYIKAREVFEINKSIFPNWNHPWLISMANKGVENTQFIYSAVNKPAFSRTTLGKIFTRFQTWTINSMTFKKHIVEDAIRSGLTGSNYEKFKNMLTIDLFVMGLASMFPYSVFGATLSAPYNYLVSLSEFLFGDSEEKKKAFYGVLPYPANILQPILPSSSRIVTNTINTMLTGDWERFVSYYMWTYFPFGRFGRDVVKTIDNPSMVMENMLGLPTTALNREVAKYQRDKEKESEEDINLLRKYVF